MIDPKDLEARKAAIAELMGAQLRVGGRSYEARLKRARRRLPGWVRREAQRLVEAGQLAAHPKLARRIDAAALDTAEARIIRYLESLDPAEARKSFWLHLTGELVLKLLIVAGLFFAALRGFGHI